MIRIKLFVLGGVVYQTNWDRSPALSTPRNCAVLTESQKWRQVSCSDQYNFYCKSKKEVTKPTQEDALSPTTIKASKSGFDAGEQYINSCLCLSRSVSEQKSLHTEFYRSRPTLIWIPFFLRNPLFTLTWRFSSDFLHLGLLYIRTIGQLC